MSVRAQYAAVERLAVMVQRSRELAEHLGAPSGQRENLDMIARQLQKIRSFQDSDARKRIGVFGPPKRGKSTLLNVLLGADLLPTSPVPMSSTVIEVEQDASLKAWEVRIYHANGRIELRPTESEREVARLIEQYGSTRGGTPATKLLIRAAFPGCRILERGGVLVDTPGAEVAFDSDERLEEDTARALRILTSVHVVLFCVRADQLGARTDCAFYEQHMRLLSPLNVVGFRDKWQEDTGELLDEAMNQYGFPERATLTLSARLASEARQAGADIQPSGVLALEERILNEIDRLTPESGLLPCLVEYQQAVKHEPRMLPEKIRIETFREALSACGDQCSETMRLLEEDRPFWKLK